MHQPPSDERYLVLGNEPAATAFPDKRDTFALREYYDPAPVCAGPVPLGLGALDAVPIGDGRLRVVFPGVVGLGELRVLAPAGTVVRTEEPDGPVVETPEPWGLLVAPADGVFRVERAPFSSVDVTGLERHEFDKPARVWIEVDGRVVFEWRVPGDGTQLHVRPDAACRRGEVLARWWVGRSSRLATSVPPTLGELLGDFRASDHPKREMASDDEVSKKFEEALGLARLGPAHLGAAAKIAGDMGHLAWAEEDERAALLTLPLSEPLRWDMLPRLSVGSPPGGPDAAWAFARAAFRFRRGLALLRDLRSN